MNIKKHIPNFLTCCNLLCGVLGIIELFNWGLSSTVTYYILAAGLFDFLDGFAARILKVSSPIGKELDSMADMVTFGVLPSLIMYKSIAFVEIVMLQNKIIPNFLYYVTPPNIPEQSGQEDSFITYFALLIVVFSAIRLAKFNVDTRQSDRFIGLPTPANALFVSSLPFILPSAILYTEYLIPIYFGLVLLCFILPYLLVAELPLLALKFKNFGWHDNKMRYVLIISSIILFAIFNFTSIPIIIILYIILSLIENKLLSPQKTQDSGLNTNN